MFFKKITTWRDVADAARTTVGMKPGIKEPNSNWKKNMLLAEHSPIRQLIFKWKWLNIKSWVSVHFVRHKIGIEHFVKTQRVDRTGINRDNKPQNSLVDHECIANAQSIINISRKRLCSHASKETREEWKKMLLTLKEEEKELYNVCVPECIYRGFCPELSCCGFSETENYKKALKIYRNK